MSLTHPPLDTLLRALGGQAASPVLFLGALPHPQLPPLTLGWQPFKPAADVWDQAGFTRLDALADERCFPTVLLLPGKSRDETLASFALARDQLAPGGRLIAALANTAGAARFEKEFAKATGGADSIQKHKCRAFSAVEDGTWDESLFKEWRALGEPRTIPGTRYRTQAGIFSPDHIDPASQLLIGHLPPSLHGRVADLGAGWGFLSDQILQRAGGIDHIDLYDADARALDCARHNLGAHASRSIGYHWHDLRRGIEGKYHAIVMNPPFHSGQATDPDLGRAFIRTAHEALRRGGQLFLVANRQLPYEATLDELKFNWNIRIADGTFKVIEARKV